MYASHSVGGTEHSQNVSVSESDVKYARSVCARTIVNVIEVELHTHHFYVKFFFVCLHVDRTVTSCISSSSILLLSTSVVVDLLLRSVSAILITSTYVRVHTKQEKTRAFKKSVSSFPLFGVRHIVVRHAHDRAPFSQQKNTK